MPFSPISSKIRWWLPPEQRQRWGDSNILPSSSTLGQIFFDLFYVAGAINLGTLLKESRSNQGILYFIIAGLSIMMIWFDKMRFDARFVTPASKDVFHRILEVLQIGFVATSLSRIRETQVMSDSCQHTDMLEFCGSLFASFMITIFRYLEVIWFEIGDPGAKVAALIDIKWKLAPTLFFLAATIDSSLSYFGNQETCQRNDRPIKYCLGAWIAWVVIGYIYMMVLTPKEGLREVSVPMNIHFCMHRYGEWFMLMFGESIISLLIVDGHNESFDYNIAFFSGILSVVFLAHLHFAAEPHRPESHALGRSRRSSFLYTLIVPIYSVALIAIGVSYKMFLCEFISGYYDAGDSAHRFLNKDGDRGGETYNSYYEQEQRQQFAANLFSGSITAVMICADLMLLLHKGLPEVLRESRMLSKCSLTVFVFLKVFLLVLLCILCFFQNDPHIIAFCGLAAIVFQEFLLYFSLFFTEQRKQAESTDHGTGDAEVFIDVSTWLSTKSTFPANVSDERSEQTLLALFERQELNYDNEHVQGQAGLATGSRHDEDFPDEHGIKGSGYAKMTDGNAENVARSFGSHPSTP